jgi:hypothetical protein
LQRSIQAKRSTDIRIFENCWGIHVIVSIKLYAVPVAQVYSFQILFTLEPLLFVVLWNKYLVRVQQLPHSG